MFSILKSIYLNMKRGIIISEDLIFCVIKFMTERYKFTRFKIFLFVLFHRYIADTVCSNERQIVYITHIILINAFVYCEFNWASIEIIFTAIYI